MHELVNRIANQRLIQFCIAIQTQGNIGIDQTEECGRVGALAAFHIAMIHGSAQEHKLKDILLALAATGSLLEGLTAGRSEPHRMQQPVKLWELLENNTFRPEKCQGRVI